VTIVDLKNIVVRTC